MEKLFGWWGIVIIVATLVALAFIVGRAWPSVGMRTYLAWQLWKMHVRARGRDAIAYCAHCGHEMLEVQIRDREGNPRHDENHAHFTMASPERIYCRRSNSDHYDDVGVEAAWPTVSGEHKIPAETQKRKSKREKPKYLN